MSTANPHKLPARYTITRRPVTRAEQRPDTIYVQEVGGAAFVSPDGEGRYYYDSLAEAVEQHGELPVRVCPSWTD